MSALSDAVDRFLAVVAAHSTMRDLHDAANEVQQQIPDATRDDLDAGLRKLLPIVRTGHMVPTGTAVILCGAMVEFGGDPEICGEAILDRVPGLLRGVAGFLDEVHRRDGTEPGGDNDLDQMINRHINDIIAADPDFAWAYISQRPLTLGAIAHLSKSKRLRGVARSRPELLQLSRDADGAAGHGSFLTDMFRVLDDERLVVLHPGERKGFEVRISGVADNFQLHTLLADALIGDPKAGWLTGTKPDPVAAAAARDGEIPERRASVTGAFNLWNWPALQPDGTLPQGQANAGWWIWNEGNPGDIRPFPGETAGQAKPSPDGVRVVLLGPPPYSRSWNAGRRFPSMPGELTVEHVLAPDVVRDWLARLAAAPKPETPAV